MALLMGRNRIGKNSEECPLKKNKFSLGTLCFKEWGQNGNKFQQIKGRSAQYKNLGWNRSF